jgi:hypothetical protein
MALSAETGNQILDVLQHGSGTFLDWHLVLQSGGKAHQGT